MAISDFVNLTIAVNTLGLARAGFGVPLLASFNASFAERTRTYTDLTGVAADFPVTTSPEYKFAQAVFGQTPHPSSIKIGRFANKAEIEYRITPTAINSHKYQYKVQGQGVTTTTVEFTSDASATVAEICTGLTTALNLVVGKNFTASDDTTHVTITADAAGNWFTIEQLAFGDGKIETRHADPGVAADIAAVVIEDDSWYCLYVPSSYGSPALADAAMDDIEARKKIYLVETSESDAIKVAVGGGDLLDTMKTDSRSRCAGLYHQDPASFFGAAWLGKMLPKLPGQATWHGKNLSGPAAGSFTSTHLTNLKAKNANYYLSVGGKNVTFNGKTGDGDYIDVQRTIDDLDDDMAVSIANALVNSDKVPFTDEGVVLIENEVRGALERKIDQGGLAADPAPTVQVPKVADVSTADKSARTLPNVKFSATLAGAIHKVNVNGTVTV